DALAVATAGDVVAIAAGEYAEELDVPPGVTVRGVCPTETSIATTSSPAVRLTGEGSVLRDVEVAGTGEIGVALEGAANATLSGVFVTAASRHALVVTGGSVTMSDVWIHDVGGERGRVVSFAGGAEGALSAVVIEDVEGLGFQLIEGASVDATQLVVRRCTVAPGSSLAGGVRLDSG
ncbi:MAG: hypothetical protein GWN73_15580, partial [Actinobacteria bacterium]|nr:hypothetical protein [Actinomycetota bacterium]NIU66758.1 hypothetical protein [Actinomycetota bacterium]NIW28561.1 hypothetical protein [Actinomycetota bacterium]